MTEEAPVAPTMPECNGSVPSEKGPLQVIGVIDEIANSVGTVPYVDAETSPDAPLTEENQEENRNLLAEDTARGDLDGEQQCEGNVRGCLSLSVGKAKLCFMCHPHLHSLCAAAGPGDAGTAVGSEEPEPGAGTLAARAAQEDTEEEEEEEEEEDTEEDEVQVIEIKENGKASRPGQQDGSKEASPPTSPGCNSQAEKPGEQPSLGKKNDISRHSYSRYNTISYRRIRKGNTKQRIDEFESMMHL
ncbi:ERMIN protein, partial [Aegotheles bennettii]|nr:ERMIN protein [Aegotheles bennettii]